MWLFLPCLSYSLIFRYTNNTEAYLVTDLSKIEDVDSYPLTYLDVNRVEINKKTSEIIIFTRSNGPITRKTHGNFAFEKAMVYAMNTMSYWIPG